MPTPLGPTVQDFDFCEEAMVVNSNTVETEIIDLQVTKTANVPFTMVGQTICYTVTIVNNSDVDVEDILFTDPLESYLTYVDGSFAVDGTPETPTVTGNEIQYELSVPAGATVLVTFCVVVNSMPPADS